MIIIAEIFQFIAFIIGWIVGVTVWAFSGVIDAFKDGYNQGESDQ